MSKTGRQFSELKANPKNPRRISDFDFKNLVQSVREFGDLSGIVYNVRTGQLVGGHQRIEAFKALGGNPQIVIGWSTPEHPNAKGTIAYGHVNIGDEQFPYREVDWPPEREAAANIAANRIQGEWDLDLLAEVSYELHEAAPDLLELTGQSDKEVNDLLDMVGAKGENPEDDEVPEVDDSQPPISKLGEIYQLGKHRLMCGDATDFGAVSDLMDGAEADMVFTDPPYGVDYEGKTKDKLTIQNDGDTEVFARAIENFITKPGASFYVCAPPARNFLAFANAFEQKCYQSATIIWAKNSMVLGHGDYHYQHEPIIYGWDKGGTHKFYGDRSQTTIWNIDRPSRSEEHPTMKPIALVERALVNSSQRGNIVLDLFGGSGSTLIAADKLDRTCYMMEIDPRYCDVIRKRYHKHITGSEEGWAEATPAIQPATA